MKLFVHAIFATDKIFSALGFQEKKELQVLVPFAPRPPCLTAVTWSPRVAGGPEPMLGPLPPRAVEVLEPGSVWEAQEGEPAAHAV